MPRAHYRPFTAYEEAVGFRGAKRNAHIFIGLFFAGIIFKVLLTYNFSPVCHRQMDEAQEEQWGESLTSRAMMAEQWMTKDSMKTSMERRRNLPPPLA